MGLPPRVSRLPCRVSVSSMGEQQKMSIKALVVLLGGRYTVKMGDFNTHLIVPFATGEKFKAAGPRGVVPVTHHWLIALAKQGACVPSIGSCPVLGSVAHRAEAWQPWLHLFKCNCSPACLERPDVVSPMLGWL